MYFAPMSLQTVYRTVHVLHGLGPSRGKQRRIHHVRTIYELIKLLKQRPFHKVKTFKLFQITHMTGPEDEISALIKQLSEAAQNVYQLHS